MFQVDSTNSFSWIIYEILQNISEILLQLPSFLSPAAVRKTNLHIQEENILTERVGSAWRIEAR